MSIVPSELPARNTRVLIIDDHPLVRAGFRALLEAQADFSVCGETGSCHEALAIAERTSPDAAIVDLSLIDGNGLDLVKRLHARLPHIRLLVCSMHDQEIYAPRVIKCGAHGFINKQEAAQNVIAALRTVLSGKIYLNLPEQDEHASGDPAAFKQLSNRELEVFGLIGHGLKTSEIATRLHLSVKTVETHRARIRRKLRLASGVDLVRAAAVWTAEDA